MWFLRFAGLSTPVLIFLAVVVPMVAIQSGCSEDTPTNVVTQKYDPDAAMLSRRVWYPASPPVDPVNTSAVLSDTLHASAYWYQIEPSYSAHRRDFNPNLDRREDVLVSTLDIEPINRPDAWETKWTGVMRGFPASGHPGPAMLDLSGRRYLEIWVNDFKPDPAEREGTLYIDIGIMDEDFYEPREDFWNDEDADRFGFNAAIDDTGLDGEPNWASDVFKNARPDDPSEGGVHETDDRHGDDYVPQRINGRFSKVNGTERNGVFDSEDLDRSGALDQANSFFRYAIDLTSVPVLDVREAYPDYDGFQEEYHTRDSWRWYRIELSDGVPIADNGLPMPDLSRVRHLRVWVRDTAAVFHYYDADGRGRLQIARLKFTGEVLP